MPLPGPAWPVRPASRCPSHGSAGILSRSDHPSATRPGVDSKRSLKLVIEGGLLLAAASAVLGCSTADGQVCANDDECRSGSACLYKIADLCAATRTCQALPTEETCHHGYDYCDCEGNVFYLPVCHLPPGYSRVRVGGTAALLAGPCPRGVKPVGAPCTDKSQCGVSQVCAFSVAAGCASQGSCQPETLTEACPLDASLDYCGCGASTGKWVIAECAAPPGTATEPVSMRRPPAGCPAPDAGVD
jgi:hypothetical protein